MLDSIPDQYVPVIINSSSVPAGAYDPQGGGVPPAYDSTAALTDQLTNLAQWAQWYSWVNRPELMGWVLAALVNVSGQLAAGGSAARAEYLDFVKDAERIHESGEPTPQWLADRGQAILEAMRHPHQ